MNGLKTLVSGEFEHHRHCYLCHTLDPQQRPDLCVWHYALVTARITWFLLRTNQYGKGRWQR